ncbi:hypothetical protein [Mesorhizobium sp. SP-1A]|uniref:hypothetical protein n=1 Tax=Mesorhizobium sp. SP-1A TaxID=3077840 RepID=UPI0028F74877|nr:hypothetical protein [Mesorhizobium sp. SP-1A]
MDAHENEDEQFHFYGISFPIPQTVMTVIRNKKQKLEFDYAVIGFEYIEERYLKDGMFDVESLRCVSEDMELLKASFLLAKGHGVNRWPMEDEKPVKYQMH